MDKHKIKSKQTIWMRYLRGELSNDENRKLEQRLSNSTDSIPVFGSIEKNELSASELEQDLKDIRQRWQQRSKPNNNYLQIWIGRVAAVLFLGFTVWAVFNYYQDQQNASLYANYFDNNNYLAVRGDGDANPSFTLALEHFENKDYENSFAQFQHLSETSPNDEQNYIYAALSAMQLGKKFEARQMLNQVKSLGLKPSEKASAYWYTALIYLQENNKTACQQELNWLLENTPQGQWGSNAAKLMKEL